MLRVLQVLSFKGPEASFVVDSQVDVGLVLGKEAFNELRVVRIQHVQEVGEVVVLRRDLTVDYMREQWA